MKTPKTPSRLPSNLPKVLSLGWFAMPAALLVLLVGAGPRQDAAVIPTPPTPPTGEAPHTPVPLLERTLSAEQAKAWLADIAPASELDALAAKVVAVYEERDFEPAWVGPQPVLRRARTMLRQILRAERLGLSPDDYPAPDLFQEVKRLEMERYSLPIELLETEVRLTGLLTLFVRDLHQGQVSPDDIPNWYKKAAPADVPAQVLDILDSKKLIIEPEHDGYLRLAPHAQKLRQVVAEGGWETIPSVDQFAPGETIPEGMLGPFVARLQAGGDLDSAFTPSSDTYVPELVEALRSFQSRHGLKVDGKVGPDTLTALNKPAVDRLAQIEANLERWRWLPNELPKNRVEVNVAGFELFGYRNHREELRMKVAVGKPSWATPIFEDEILYAEVNPYWNVPQSIAADEVLPALRSNPNYLREENMEVVAGWNAENAGQVIDVDWSNPGSYGSDYRIRQRPGSTNALGRIKFIFPNNHSVYLHDTPAQRPFQRANRAVSHGCVRVAEPMALAEFLFGWDDLSEIREAMSGTRQTRVDLDKPMPVIFHYRTAFVDDEGRLNFRRDLYGMDEALAENLDLRLDGPTEAVQVAKNELADAAR